MPIRLLIIPLAHGLTALTGLLAAAATSAWVPPRDHPTLLCPGLNPLPLSAADIHSYPSSMSFSLPPTDLHAWLNSSPATHSLQPTSAGPLAQYHLSWPRAHTRPGRLLLQIDARTSTITLQSE